MTQLSPAEFNRGRAARSPTSSSTGSSLTRLLQPLLAWLRRGVGGAAEVYNRNMRLSPLRTKALTSCAVALLGEVVGAAINARVVAARSGGSGFSNPS
jgi:hypothetical protein